MYQATDFALPCHMDVHPTAGVDPPASGSSLAAVGSSSVALPEWSSTQPPQQVMHDQHGDGMQQQQQQWLALQQEHHEQQQQPPPPASMPALEGPTSSGHSPAVAAPTPSSSFHAYSDSPSIKVEIPSVPSFTFATDPPVQATPLLPLNAAGSAASMSGPPSGALAASPYAFGPAGAQSAAAASFAAAHVRRAPGRTPGPGLMTAAKKPLEIRALQEIGFIESQLVPDDMHTVDPADEAMVKHWMVKMEMATPALRRAQEVKNEYTAAAHIQMCSSVYACRCASIKYGQKLKTVQHIKKKHMDRPQRVATSYPAAASAGPAHGAPPSDGDAFTMAPDELKRYVKAMDASQLAAFAAMYGLTPEQALDIAGVRGDDDEADETGTTAAAAGHEQVKMEHSSDSPPKDTCSYCGQTSDHLLQCSACMTAIYCSHTCQKHHWRAHKPECKKAQEAATEAAPAGTPPGTQPEAGATSAATATLAVAAVAASAPVVSANGLPMPRIPPATAPAASTTANPFHTAPLVQLTPAAPAPAASKAAGATTPPGPIVPIPLAHSFAAAAATPQMPVDASSASLSYAAAGAAVASSPFGPPSGAPSGSSDPHASSPLDALLLELQIWKDEAMRLRRGKSRQENRKRKSAAQDEDAAMLPVALQAAMVALQEWRTTFGTNDPQEAIQMYVRKSPEEIATIQAAKPRQAEEPPTAVDTTMVDATPTTRPNQQDLHQLQPDMALPHPQLMSHYPAQLAHGFLPVGPQPVMMMALPVNGFSAAASPSFAVGATHPAFDAQYSAVHGAPCFPPAAPIVAAVVAAVPHDIVQQIPAAAPAPPPAAEAPEPEHQQPPQHASKRVRREPSWLQD